MQVFLNVLVNIGLIVVMFFSLQFLGKLTRR